MRKNRDQKIEELFDYFKNETNILERFGKNFAKFLVSKRSFELKKDFIRKMLNNNAYRDLSFFKNLSDFIKYKITFEDLKLTIWFEDESVNFVNQTKQYFGKNLAKEIFEFRKSCLLKEQKSNKNVSKWKKYIKELELNFPEFC
ncbi:MAG: hypothetical protein WCO35_00430 [Candidatus Nomurabacteria bacterium]